MIWVPVDQFTNAHVLDSSKSEEIIFTLEKGGRSVTYKQNLPTKRRVISTI